MPINGVWNDTEKAWTTFDQELRAIVLALDNKAVIGFFIYLFLSIILLMRINLLGVAGTN
jgi:hypothetical protein